MFEEILNTLESLPVARGESWTELRAGETEGATMGGIFISYRRDDATGYVHALRDRLAARFGPGQIFMDIDSIEPGLDFVEVIESSVASCDVVLALIGKRWLQSERLQDPRDFVRLEIQAALARKIRVIPVLLEGTEMPSAEELPDVLSPLSHRQAFEISNRHFSDDLNQLAELLGRILAEQESKKKTSAALPPQEALRKSASVSPDQEPKPPGQLTSPSQEYFHQIAIWVSTFLAWLAAIGQSLLASVGTANIIRNWPGKPEGVFAAFSFVVSSALLLSAVFVAVRKLPGSSKLFQTAGLWQFVSLVVMLGILGSNKGIADYLSLSIFLLFAAAYFFLAYRYKQRI